MMSKPCEKFRWKISNINIARLRLLPLQPMLDCNRCSLYLSVSVEKSQNVALLPPILITCISVIKEFKNYTFFLEFLP